MSGGAEKIHGQRENYVKFEGKDFLPELRCRPPPPLQASVSHLRG